MLSVDGVRAYDHVLAAMLCRFFMDVEAEGCFSHFCCGVRKLQRVNGTTTTDGEGKQRRLKDGNKVTFRCRCCFPSALRVEGVSRYLVVGERLRILGSGEGQMFVWFGLEPLQRNVGIQFHLGKTREYNRSGTVPKKVLGK